MAWRNFTRSYFAVSTLSLCTRWWEWSWLDGIAGLFASDLLAKDTMGKAGDVLRTQYGIAAEHLEFFDRFAQDAEEDLDWEESTLVEWAFTTERQLTAARAFRYRLDIDYQYVQPVHAAITTGELPVQVPVSLYEEEPPSL
ncbi:MAG: hypothetical protein F4Z88_03960 [Chloroflexi bacterium]|nr:hypothetical protein [Chloroflexota bacterium]